MDDAVDVLSTLQHSRVQGVAAVDIAEVGRAAIDNGTGLAVHFHQTARSHFVVQKAERYDQELVWSVRYATLQFSFNVHFDANSCVFKELTVRWLYTLSLQPKRSTSRYKAAKFFRTVASSSLYFPAARSSRSSISTLGVLENISLKQITR